MPEIEDDPFEMKEYSVAQIYHDRLLCLYAINKEQTINTEAQKSPTGSQIIIFFTAHVSYSGSVV